MNGTLTPCRSLLLRNLIVADRPGQDVLVAEGVIRRTGSALAAPEGTETVDCGGALLLPSLMDPHVHLDKTRLGAPRLHHPVTGSVNERAANERRLREELRHDPALFGSRLVRLLSRMGTTHLRTHVDVDDAVGLRHVEAILRVREKYRDGMGMELVAFPQSGVLHAPGVADFLAEAVRLGVDAIGGVDPQGFDKDREAGLNCLFGLAEKTGAPLDIHLHETGEGGLATLRAILDRVRAHGMRGRVAISHGYVLGELTPEQEADLLPQLAELEIAVIGAAPGSRPLPPVEALLDAGVLYAGASDNIQDMWSPWGNGDQLERAMLLAYRSSFRADAPLRRCLGMVTEQPARLFGIQGHTLDLKPGMAANLTAVRAEDPESALLQRPPRLFTLKDGTFTARGGESLLPE